MDKQKENKLKISKILLTVGVIALIVGITILVVGILNYKQAKADYQVAYDRWYNAWFNDKTATLNEQPKMPGIPVMVIFGGFISLFSLVPIFLGLRPFIMKVGAKMHKETLDYAGDDISAAGVKTIEVAQPVIEKGAEVITPIIGNVAESISEGINKGKRVSTGNSNKFCSNCGAEVNKKNKFCSNCGTKIANE